MHRGVNMLTAIQHCPVQGAPDGLDTARDIDVDVDPVLNTAAGDPGLRPMVQHGGLA